MIALLIAGGVGMLGAAQGWTAAPVNAELSADAEAPGAETPSAAAKVDDVLPVSQSFHDVLGVGSAVPAPVETRDTLPAGDRLVPDILGLDIAAAAVRLEEAGLRLGAIDTAHSASSGGTVIGSSPRAGALVGAVSVVGVTVATGSNLVPDVGGMDSARAVAIIESAGFAARLESIEAARLLAERVIQYDPSAGTVMALGSIVVVTVGIAPPPPE